MSPSPPQVVLPVRRGIPVDPVTQLAAGELRRLPDVTTTIAGWVLCAPANPERICLYVASWPAAGNWWVAPAPVTTSALVGSVPTQFPIAIHCRDYPGMTQSEWYVSGTAVLTVSVWEYVLQPWW